MLELGPDWLEPSKFDLTFTNVKTQKCLINNTDVRRKILHAQIDIIGEGKCRCHRISDMCQVFKIVPGSACYTEFYIPEMNLNVVPLPERAVLKGKNASFYQVEQVCELRYNRNYQSLSC